MLVIYRVFKSLHIALESCSFN